MNLDIEHALTINVNKKKVVPDLIFVTAQRSEN